MSAYLEFYLKRDGIFTELEAFPRGSFIAQAVGEYVNYEHAVKFTDHLAELAQTWLKDKIENTKATIKACEDRIDFLRPAITGATGDSFTTVMDEYEYQRNTIIDCREDMEYMQAAIIQIGIFNGIAENLSYQNFELWVGYETGDLNENPEFIVKES